MDLYTGNGIFFLSSEHCASLHTSVNA